jgi:hypothetical protein
MERTKLVLALVLAATWVLGQGNWREAANLASQNLIDRQAAMTQESLQMLATAKSKADAQAATRILSAAAQPISLDKLAGQYRCRSFQPTPEDVYAYPYFPCRVVKDGVGWRFEKTSGSQGTIGRLYPDGSKRLIYLGAYYATSFEKAFEYGTDAERDMPGILEKIDEAKERYRLLILRDNRGLDFFEMVRP